MKRLCGARTKSGGFCRQRPVPDGLRCRFHGAKGGRPSGFSLTPKQLTARVEGQARYIARLREAKAAGLIERFPWGRRPKNAPKLSSDKRVRKAQRIVEARLVMVEKLALPVKPWAEMSRGEKLSSNADRALTVTKEFLDREIDPDDPRMVALQQQTALAVIGYQLRAETARLPSAASSAAAGPIQGIKIIVGADDPLLDDGERVVDLEVSE